MGSFCAYPGCSKQVWVDANGSPTRHCGRSHRDAMKKKAPTNNGGAHSAAPYAVCKLANCHRPVFVSANGVPGYFCGKTHQAQAVMASKGEVCLLCKTFPKVVVRGEESDFCSMTCRNAAIQRAPAIYELTANSKDFISGDLPSFYLPLITDVDEVVNQFNGKWEHTNKPVGNVVKVWKIYQTKALKDTFNQYRLRVEHQRGHDNALRRFHGTIRACRLGDNNHHRDLCKHPTCSLCSIIRNSFQIKHSGTRYDFGRFGRGIYTSATSSKSDDYTQNVSPYASGQKAMLLTHVVMGNGIKLRQDNESLTKPPAGYDSVIGEPGGSLNYDEAVVYSNDAVRPLYLIIYE